MKKRTVWILIITFIIAISILILTLPYVLVNQSVQKTNKHQEIALLNTAVKVSVFDFQKQYTLEWIIPSLVLTKDYESAIKRIKELEKFMPLDNGVKYLAAYSYMQLGDYQNALNYAKELENKKLQTKIYTKLKEKENNGKLN